jgi:disulfide bond formation protein DsbB
MRHGAPVLSFLKRNPFLFSLFISGSGVGFSFFFSDISSCSSCQTQRVLWALLVFCCLIGHFYKNKLMLFPLLLLSLLIGYFSSLKINMAGLFKKSEYVLVSSVIPQGLSCKSPHFLKISLPMWSFLGALLVCMSTVFFIWILARREKS